MIILLSSTVFIISILLSQFYNNITSPTLSSSIAVAVVLSSYLSIFFLLAYIKLTNTHKLTWGGWSVKSLQNWWSFLKLGIPGLFLTGFEWWVYEISLFVSGSINEVELGVNSVVLQILNLVFMVSRNVRSIYLLNILLYISDYFQLLISVLKIHSLILSFPSEVV